MADTATIGTPSTFINPRWCSRNHPCRSIHGFFDGAPDKPNRRGIALMTYVQWLGSWLDEYPYYEELESVKSEGY